MQHGDRHRPPAAGFTLLEVLLALGLTVALLAALYAALDLHWRYSTTGRVEMERAQIARALLQQMAIDIRSVVYRKQNPQPQADNNSTTSTSGTSTSGTSTEPLEVTDPADAYAEQSLGVFGDATTLVLHVSKPVRRGAANGDSRSFSSDLQSIAYFLAGAEGGALQQLAATTTDNTRPAEGLARLQGDRLAMNLADQQGDLSSLAAQTQMLAEEVNRLTFRYFDGVEWLQEWDSIAAGTLPTAIEITIGFRDARSAGAFAPLVSQSTETFRLVVAVPLAEPVVEEL